MKKLFFVLSTFSVIGMMDAQIKEEKKDVIIKKSGDTTIEIKDGKVMVDGEVVADDYEMKGGKKQLKNADKKDNLPFLGIFMKPTFDNTGAEIAEVMKNSPAEKEDLKVGDIITEINGKAIQKPEEVIDEITQHKPKDVLKVKYIRDKKEKVVSLELAEKPQELVRNQKRIERNIPFDLFGMNGAEGMQGLRRLDVMNENEISLGMQIEDLDGDKEGVKVLSVEENSLVAKAGIKKDDIIVNFNKEKIKSTDDMAMAKENLKPNTKVEINVLRNNKPLELNLEIPKNKKKIDL